MDDISRKYVGSGRLFFVHNSWPNNPVNTITIDHITGFPDSNGGILTLANQLSNPAMYGLVFTNSIVMTGSGPVWNSGGGKTSCAYARTPLQKIANCFTTYTFTDNALVAAPSRFPPSSWPTGNLFVSDMNDVGFIRCNGGNGGDYKLLSSSPYKNKGTDGMDLGADIVGLNEALAGVE